MNSTGDKASKFVANTALASAELAQENTVAVSAGAAGLSAVATILTINTITASLKWLFGWLMSIKAIYDGYVDSIRILTFVFNNSLLILSKLYNHIILQTKYTKEIMIVDLHLELLNLELRDPAYEYTSDILLIKKAILHNIKENYKNKKELLEFKLKSIEMTNTEYRAYIRMVYHLTFFYILPINALVKRIHSTYEKAKKGTTNFSDEINEFLKGALHKQIKKKVDTFQNLHTKLEAKKDSDPATWFSGSFFGNSPPQLDSAAEDDPKKLNQLEELNEKATFPTLGKEEMNDVNNIINVIDVFVPGNQEWHLSDLGCRLGEFNLALNCKTKELNPIHGVSNATAVLGAKPNMTQICTLHKKLCMSICSLLQSCFIPDTNISDLQNNKFIESLQNKINDDGYTITEDVAGPHTTDRNRKFLHHYFFGNITLIDTAAGDAGAEKISAGDAGAEKIFRFRNIEQENIGLSSQDAPCTEILADDDENKEGRTCFSFSTHMFRIYDEINVNSIFKQLDLASDQARELAAKRVGGSGRGPGAAAVALRARADIAEAAAAKMGNNTPWNGKDFLSSLFPEPQNINANYNEVNYWPRTAADDPSKLLAAHTKQVNKVAAAFQDAASKSPSGMAGQWRSKAAASSARRNAQSSAANEAQPAAAPPWTVSRMLGLAGGKGGVEYSFKNNGGPRPKNMRTNKKRTNKKRKKNKKRTNKNSRNKRK
jgi:hypothetical protein